jgi:exodeoxyribonuclease VII small subunit
MKTKTPHQTQEKPLDQLTYEEAYIELERIVSMLDSGDHSLEETLTLFERGQQLAHHCAALLDNAELKVRQLSGEDLVDFNSSNLLQ